VPWLKSYPLHEASPDSFGAICGGEVVVFFEPQHQAETLYVVGAGHCARAIVAAAQVCGWGVVVLEDRADELEKIPRGCRVVQGPPDQFIAAHAWRSDDALVLVSRNYVMDREALAAALGTGGYGYLGMIGSERKVRRVFDELLARGVSREIIEAVHAPIGLDIGAESPAEIAVSVVAEVMRVLRKKEASPKAN
jgi:xanthine dehydrogenase accessory factor